MSEQWSEPHQGWSSGDIISADNADVAAEQLDSLSVRNAAEGPLVPGYQDGCPQIPEYARDLVLAGLAHVNLPAGEYARLHYFIKGMWYSSFVLHAIQDPAKDLVQGILANMEDGHLYSPEARERLFAVIGYIKKRVARGLGEEGKTGKRQARAPAKERKVTPKTLEAPDDPDGKENQTKIRGRLIFYSAIRTYVDTILPLNDWSALQAEERAEAWKSFMASARKRVEAMDIQERRNIYCLVKRNTYNTISSMVRRRRPASERKMLMENAKRLDARLLEQARIWVQHGGLSTYRGVIQLSDLLILGRGHLGLKTQLLRSRRKVSDPKMLKSQTFLFPNPKKSMKSLR